MKLRLAMLVLMIAAQPVQAGFCVMDLSDGPDGSVAMPHHPDAGDGANAGSNAGSNVGAHDCCASPAADELPADADHCGMSCGTCAVGAPAIPAAAALGALPPAVTLVVIQGGAVSPSHAAPPFRPPIHIS